MVENVKILICPDSFKESLTAGDAARAIGNGLRRVSGRISCAEVPLSDGGEGFVDAMIAGGGSRKTCRVRGPLGDPVQAEYALLPDGETAVLEMASAAGLGLIPEKKRRPLEASTYGVGELMLDAIDNGVKRIVMGIGGSATTDGGAGMAEALGVRLLDAERNRIGPGGNALNKLDRIDLSGLCKEMENVEILAACDVKNPLLGPNGAAAVYGPQKGASKEDIAVLETGLERFARVAQKDLGRDVSDVPGAGAAGGLGAGLMLFCGAKLSPGIEVVSETLDLKEKVRESHWVITGEGKTDATSAQGKVVGGVLDLCKEAEKPCVILTGSIGEGSDTLLERGAVAVLSIVNGPMDITVAMAGAGRLIEDTAYNLGRIILKAEERRSDK